MSEESTHGAATAEAAGAFSSPFVTVVIPCRNHGRYLRRAVESAFAQDEVGEVIVIEDGGEDGADTLCGELERECPGRFRWVRHEPGKAVGAGTSRNEGIRLARFDWVAFLDADDRYLPGRFAEDVRVLAADPSLDGVYDALGAEALDDPDGTIAGGHPDGIPRYGIAPGRLTTLRGRYRPGTLLSHLNPIGMDGSFSTDTILLHRRLFEKTGTLFGTRKTGEDTLLWLQAAAVGRLAPASLDKPVAMRGLHEETRRRVLETSRGTALEVLGDFLDWARDRRLPEETLLMAERARLHFAADWGDVVHSFVRRPRLLTSLATWCTILRWALVRQFPDDPVLPGFFPSLRRKSLS